MRNFEGDARYLAHLWNTLIDNNYLTREFIMAHPEIVEDAHNASGRIIEAAQQSVHPTNDGLIHADDESTPAVISG